MTGPTRREALGLAAGAVAAVAVGERWVFAVREGAVVKAVAEQASPWQPRLLQPDEGEALARLVDVLIPRTDTPGARDARVHEYVDLAVSLDEPKVRKTFVKGLRWLDRRCRREQGTELAAASEEVIAAVLRPLSDERTSYPSRLQAGADFFADLKRRTIFGYYTSLEGRVEELGLSDVTTMETWTGCRHSTDDHG